MDHPAGRPLFATLADWVDGRLAPDVAASIARSLSDADTTTDEAVRWLCAFVDAGAEFPLHRPPPTLKEGLVHHFAFWSAARADRLGTQAHRPCEEYEATLVFDSRLHTAITAIRGGDTSTGMVHIGYSCDIADIVLDLARQRHGDYAIEGQVLLLGNQFGPPFRATVRGSKAPDAMADVLPENSDVPGGFSVRGVPATTCYLVVDNGQVRIIVPLDLSAQP